MNEVIQEWLGTRLGILLDMNPQKFSRNTKDGTLLAKLLYNYGVIPLQVLEKVKESKNYYDCCDNLVILKPWLNYIGAIHDDSTLKKMAGGEASASISIFYAVYLNLERKDRLYYLSAQKEKRFSEDNCRFKVDWVPEKALLENSGETYSKLLFPLAYQQKMIDHHKANCQKVIEIIKKTKKKFEHIVGKNVQNVEQPPVCRYSTSNQIVDKRLEEAKETKKEINSFEKKHPYDCPNLTYAELIMLKKLQQAKPCSKIPDIAKAREIVNNIKRRKRNELYAKNLQLKMQNMVLDDQWKYILEKQEKEFENTVCANLLKQSQYEKQMASKLSHIRNQKKVLAQNRKKIENLKIEHKIKEYDEMLASKSEKKGDYWEEECEKDRTIELHRKIYDDKVKKRVSLLKEESRKIWEGLIDLAVGISEIRELTGCQVPKALLKDMKELFIKSLPIFDIVNNFDVLHESDSRLNLGLEDSEDKKEHLEDNLKSDFSNTEKEIENERLKLLDRLDLFDYLNLTGPWVVQLYFPEGTESEVNHAVVGYIVHKLLEVKYPAPNIPDLIPLKPMKPATVVLGLSDSVACEMLTDLLKLCRVLVVRVEDAINFVLRAYKEELSSVKDLDVTFQRATANALKDKTSFKKEKEEKKKLELLKKEEVDYKVPSEDLIVLDKQTQTPRKIPDDDHLFSSNTKLGKLAFEALGVGDPVPDPVIASAIVAYVLANQHDCDGWVLLNYPILYSQASELECVLTGQRVLPRLKKMKYLEDVEGFTYRENCISPFSADVVDERRESKIVPKPKECNTFSEKPRTYFDAFVLVKKIPDLSNRKSEDVEEELGPMEKFYSDQKILFDFEYTSFNYEFIKKLSKAILGVTADFSTSSSEVVPKTSIEIFGKEIFQVDNKWGTSVKKIVKETTSKKLDSESFEFVIEKQSEEKVERNKESALPEKPGDPGWQWATGIQSEQVQLVLATLWEHLEAVYLEDLKNFFFTIRIHRSDALSYGAFIKKTARTLMRRPDEKQKVLSDFHQMFNKIDEDLRPDVDIKCELHVRVSELEEALMEIADQRKANSLKDLKKMAQNNWVSDQMAGLVNCYLHAVQIETDRCIDTCQIIMDYYTTLQGKVPDEKLLNKVLVPTIEIKHQKVSRFSSPSMSVLTSQTDDAKLSTMSTSDVTKSSEDKISKNKIPGDKKKQVSETSFLTEAGQVITDILVRLSLPPDGKTPFQKFLTDSSQFVTREIKDIIEKCINEAKKGSKTAYKVQKKGLDANLSPSRNLSGSRNFAENLTGEWIYALECELSRFLFRVKLILARGLLEINEFLTTILNLLSSLAGDVNEMYLKETQSISECCKVFRCGIEEEIAIQPRLVLKEDQFIVDEDTLLFPNMEEFLTMVVDEDQKFRFSIEYLSLLCQKFQKVAPDGEIIKLSFIYILEDLRALKPEVENGNRFPDIWNLIEPDDLTYIVNQLFKDLEIVHWKDFIIYAMELPVPTEKEILTMRAAFRRLDPEMTELVTRRNFDTVRFWFETTLDHYSEVDRNEKAKDLLYRMYQVDNQHSNYTAMLLAFCKDENPVSGFVKALALATGKKIVVKKIQNEFLSDENELEANEESGYFDDYQSSSSKKQECCATLKKMYKCISQEKIGRCECRFSQKSISEEEEEVEEEINFHEKAGEDSNYFLGSETSVGASTVPLNIITSILKTSFPSLPRMSVLLECQQTFQETLNAMYDSFQTRDDSVEVHDLVNHNFITHLLDSTNKFRFIKFRQLLNSVVEFKHSLGRVPCLPDKLNVNFCLN